MPGQVPGAFRLKLSGPACWLEAPGLLVPLPPRERDLVRVLAKAPGEEGLLAYQLASQVQFDPADVRRRLAARLRRAGLRDELVGCWSAGPQTRWWLRVPVSLDEGFD